MYINSSNFKIILDRLKVEYTSYDLEYLTKIYNQQESFEIEEIDILDSNDKNKIILKRDIENEFKNQIELLKNYFINEIKNKRIFHVSRQTASILRNPFPLCPVHSDRH